MRWSTGLLVYGSNLRGRILIQKVVIFFLSLKAHYGQVFDPSEKSFEFLSMSWHGHPKNARYDTHLSYRGSVAMKGPRLVA